MNSVEPSTHSDYRREKSFLFSLTWGSVSKTKQEVRNIYMTDKEAKLSALPPSRMWLQD